MWEAFGATLLAGIALGYCIKCLVDAIYEVYIKMRKASNERKSKR